MFVFEKLEMGSFFSSDFCDVEDLHIWLFEHFWVVAVKSVRWSTGAFTETAPEHACSLTYLAHLLGYDVVKIVPIPCLVMLE